jgi:hypothetical protein
LMMEWWLMLYHRSAVGNRSNHFLASWNAMHLRYYPKQWLTLSLAIWFWVICKETCILVHISFNRFEVNIFHISLTMIVWGPCILVTLFMNISTTFCTVYGCIKTYKWA